MLVHNQGDEWLKAMNLLYQQAALRQKIREQSYADCIANFGLQASAHKLLELITRT